MNFIKKILLVIITLSIVISLLSTLTGCPPETPKEEVEKTTTEEITTTEEVTEGVEETVEQKEPSIKIISIAGYNIETDTHYELENDKFKTNITDVGIGLKLKNIDVKEDTITVSTYLNGIFNNSFPINDALEYGGGAYYFSIIYEDGYKDGNYKFIFEVNGKEFETVEFSVEQKEPSIKIISIAGYNIETDTHYELENDKLKANITDVDIGLKLKNIDVKEDTITVSTYLNGIFESSFPINDALEYDGEAYYFSIFYEDGEIYKKGNHKFIFKVNGKVVKTVEFSVEPIKE